MLRQLCLNGLRGSQSMVRRYGGEAAGTAEDESSVGYDHFTLRHMLNHGAHR